MSVQIHVTFKIQCLGPLAERDDRKLIKTKKQIQIAELKANLDSEGEETADDGFLDALNGTAAEDWADEEG